MTVEFLPSGDTGLTVQFGDTIDRDLNRRILRLRAIVDAAGLPGVVETVPTYRSLMIHYDPIRTSHAEIVEALAPILDLPIESESATGIHWRLPVCFDGETFAPDLAHVSEWSGLDPEAIVDIMTSTTHYLYMIGFAPGQPHLGDLPESLAIPRRKNPRPGVPPGAVVIAMGLTVIYTVTNATGWHIIGRTPVPLFDATAERPVLLTPGDIISLYRVDEAKFHVIKEGIRTRTYVPERVS